MISTNCYLDHWFPRWLLTNTFMNSHLCVANIGTSRSRIWESKLDNQIFQCLKISIQRIKKHDPKKKRLTGFKHLWTCRGYTLKNRPRIQINQRPRRHRLSLVSLVFLHPRPQRVKPTSHSARKTYCLRRNNHSMPCHPLFYIYSPPLLVSTRSVTLNPQS
jgi:hypothetical protein